MPEEVVKKIQKEVEETKRVFKEKIATLILGGSIFVIFSKKTRR